MSRVFRDESELPRPAACLMCETTAKWVGEFELACACPGCGRQHLPRVAGEASSADRCYGELETLARWLPEVIGHGIPLVPPIVTLDGSHESGTTGRVRPAEFDPDDEAVGGIDGLTMHVSGRRYSQASTGRPDHVDDCSEQFAQAVVALRKLDWVASRPGGRRHALVLIYAGVHHGSESRGYWNRVSDDALAYGEEASDAYRAEVGLRGRHDALGFEWRVGTVCASEALRAFWFAHDRLEMAWTAARTLGREAVTRAFAAWAAAPADPPRPVRERLHIGNALSACTDADRAVDDEMIEVLLPKIAKRREWHRSRLS